MPSLRGDFLEVRSFPNAAGGGSFGDPALSHIWSPLVETFLSHPGALLSFPSFRRLPWRAGAQDQGLQKPPGPRVSSAQTLHKRGSGLAASSPGVANGREAGDSPQHSAQVFRRPLQGNTSEERGTISSSEEAPWQTCPGWATAPRGHASCIPVHRGGVRTARSQRAPPPLGSTNLVGGRACSVCLQGPAARRERRVLRVHFASDSVAGQNARSTMGNVVPSA